MDIYFKITKVRNLFIKFFLGANIIFGIMIFILLLNPQGKILNSVTEVSQYIIIVWILSLLGTIIFTFIKSKVGLHLVKLFKVNESMKRLSGLALLLFALLALILFCVFLYFSKKNNVVSENAPLIKVLFLSAMFFIPFSLTFLTKKIWQILFIIISTLLAIFIVIITILSPFKIRGNSMNPTLKDGQFVFSNNLAYLGSYPERGDLVIYKSPNTGNVLIGRIVGLPNESVLISNGRVYINGKLLSEPYLDTSNTNKIKTITEDNVIKLQEQSYFILGDNRNSSSGSQNLGTINISRIVSKVFIIYWPLKDFGFISTNNLEISQSRFETTITPTSAPTPNSETYLTCKTIGTKMVIQQNGYGQIGCDIETNGKIDLVRSYCIGEASHQTDILRPDAYGKENGYYVTLHNLFLNEKVHVYAFDLKGNKIECLPALN